MRLWKNTEEFKEGKYLVLRRDGTVVEWPHFVLGAKDPSTPAALRAYAVDARNRGMDKEYCGDIERLAMEFYEYRVLNGNGDPDAGPHRQDDPETIEKMRSVQNVEHVKG